MSGGAGLAEAFRFHFARGGWSIPPGRAVCAHRAAQAEAMLREREAEGRARVIWEDEEADPADCMDGVRDIQAIREGRWDWLCARLVLDGRTVASLGGVSLGGSHRERRDYQRVVEADLALEALDVLTGTAPPVCPTCRRPT